MVPVPPKFVTRFRIVSKHADVHLKIAIIEVKMKDGKTYLSYVKQELVASQIRANLTRGYFGSLSPYSDSGHYSDRDGNYENVVEYSVKPIENLAATHMCNATSSKDHMAHFIDVKGFRFQLDGQGIRHIKVKNVIELKDTVPITTEISLEEINEGESK
jgi:hypothetical protein